MKIMPVTQYNTSFTAGESQVFAGVKNVYGKLTDKLASGCKYTFDRPWLEKTISKIGQNNWFADKLTTHLIVCGSIITSSMYMKRTLENKKMDKDRRQTLAVNQGMVGVVSAIGSYVLDGVVNKWWTMQTAKFAGAQLDDKTFYGKFKTAYEGILKTNKTSESKQKLPKVESFVENLHGDEALSKLKNPIKGLGFLKSALIFGLVYRYIAPVLVTPLANKVGDHLLEQKKAKAAASP